MAEVRGEAYWWGFELTFNAAAVKRINNIGTLVAAGSPFLSAPFVTGTAMTGTIAVGIASALAVRALAYEVIAGDGGLVLASPWPLPLMLAPIRAANIPNDKMSWAVFSEGRWSNAYKFTGSNYTKARPTFAQYKNDLFLLHRGAGDNNIWYIKYDPIRGWGDSVKVPNCYTEEDVAACEYKGQLYVVHRGAHGDDSLWYTRFNGSYWAEDLVMHGMLTSSGPALAVWRDQLYCVARGNEGLLWITTYGSSHSWHHYKPMGNGKMYTSASPALAVYKDVLYCVARGNDGHLWWTRNFGDSWTEYKQMHGGDVYSSAAPSLCVFQDFLYCVARGNDGVLWWSTFDGSDWSRYVASEISTDDHGPAIISYESINSQKGPEMLCAFKTN